MPITKKVAGINVVLEYITSNDKVGVGYKVGSSVKELAQAAGADVAMDFNFANNTTGVPIGLVMIGGKIVNYNVEKTILRDSFCIQADGTFYIGKPNADTLHSAQGSPLLLQEGREVRSASIIRDQTGTDIVNGSHYRAAVGILSVNQAVLVRTIDKATLAQLTAVMTELGCIDAVNGDGGGSAYLWPYDNGWGRKMGSAILVKKDVYKMYGTLQTKQDFIPVGFANRPGDKRKPKFITVHDTANKDKGADAERHAKYLKDGAVKVPASWHWTVDDKIAIQHLPHDESAYHAGDGRKGTGNALSIGVEICEHIDVNRAKAEDNAAILIAHIMKDEELTLDAVVQHNKWSGKNCPASFRGNGTWNTFLAKIKKEYDVIMNPTPNKSGFTDVPDNHWAKTSIEKAVEKKIIVGVSEGKFDPNGNVTRAQLAVILDRCGLLDR